MKKKLFFLQAVIILLAGCSPKLSLTFKKIFPFKKAETQAEDVSCLKERPKPSAPAIEIPAYGFVSPVPKEISSNHLPEIPDLRESPNEKGSTSALSSTHINHSGTKEWGTEKYSAYKLYTKAIQLRAFAEENGYNSWIGFMIDMEVLSGKKRFFVYDLRNMSILHSGLVTHGSGGKTMSTIKSFSNLPGSSCTSLGIYKIGQPYQGEYGLAYKLYGLEASNSNAYMRNVVLHSMGCVPDTEINGLLCQSEGCPSVSPGFLQYLQSIIDNSRKPVLMWIFK